MCIDDEQFSVPRATQSNTKLVELQSRSFVGPFVASIASFSRNARTKTRLGIKVKVRARFNLDLGGRRGRGRAIKAECMAHCCAEHCRCAGAKPSNTRPVIGIPTRYLEGLIAASAFPNFIEISSYWSRMRIFRDENFFDCEHGTRPEKKRKVKERKEFLSVKGGINSRGWHEPTIDPRSERAGFLPLTLQGLFRPRQFVVIRVACIDSYPTRPTSGYLV